MLTFLLASRPLAPPRKMQANGKAKKRDRRPPNICDKSERYGEIPTHFSRQPMRKKHY